MPLIAEIDSALLQQLSPLRESAGGPVRTLRSTRAPALGVSPFSLAPPAISLSFMHLRTPEPGRHLPGGVARWTLEITTGNGLDDAARRTGVAASAPVRESAAWALLARTRTLLEGALPVRTAGVCVWAGEERAAAREGLECWRQHWELSIPAGETLLPTAAIRTGAITYPLAELGAEGLAFSAVGAPTAFVPGRTLYVEDTSGQRIRCLGRVVSRTSTILTVEAAPQQPYPNGAVIWMPLSSLAFPTAGNVGFLDESHTGVVRNTTGDGRHEFIRLRTPTRLRRIRFGPYTRGQVVQLRSWFRAATRDALDSFVWSDEYGQGRIAWMDASGFHATSHTGGLQFLDITLHFIADAEVLP